MFVRYVGRLPENRQYTAAIRSSRCVVIDSLSKQRNVSAKFQILGSKEGPLEILWRTITRDFFDLAVLVYITDELVFRPPTWHRKVNLHVPVLQSEHWINSSRSIENLLSFLTGDRFRIEWSLGRLVASLGSHNLRLSKSRYDSVCLFSGGMDSLMGAIGLLEEGRRVLLVGHRTDGQASAAQHEIFRGLQKRFKNEVDLIQCSVARSRISNPKFSLPDKVERDHRSRSFLFLALGVAVADATGTDDLVLAENGHIALNPPLSPSRMGSLTTRTAHPRYLLEFARFVQSMNIFNGKVRNPFLYHNKNDLLTNLQDWYVPLLKRSISCAHGTTSVRWAGVANVKHCGHCVPCIYRRAAMLQAGLDNPEDYIDDTFRNLNELSRARQRDMLTLIRFAKRVCRSNPTQLQSIVVSHGAFPADCGRTVGPIKSHNYVPWGDMLVRWAKQFLRLLQLD
ncbi:MAG: hypothetical protein F4Z01_07645 [Gammaproteobacteria bacterium]|nr:hypothetical protein [Gammaproteobacteria bacterium]MYF37931.1 hypothetical protein [Gammaproteobacteria bacterium]